jgi:hypothetical protein
MLFSYATNGRRHHAGYQLRSVGLHAFGDVAIGAQGDAHRGVPEAFLRDPRMRPSRQTGREQYSNPANRSV